jgi:hypothetical protein
MLRLGERWRSFRLSRKIGDEGDLCRPIPLQLNGMEINFFCFSFFFFTLAYSQNQWPPEFGEDGGPGRRRSTEGEYSDLPG